MPGNIFHSYITLSITAPTLEVQSNSTVSEDVGSVEICAVGGDAVLTVLLVATSHCSSYHACGMLVSLYTQKCAGTHVACVHEAGIIVLSMSKFRENGHIRSLHSYILLSRFSSSRAPNRHHLYTMPSSSTESLMIYHFLLCSNQ